MILSSPVFRDNEQIPQKYTCDGENISPPFKIKEVPAGTQSLVLIVDDPDAPRGLWVHWLMWNINPKTAEVGENSVPEEAVEGTTSFGRSGYGGPCPPSSIHHYFFRLYALDIKLELGSEMGKEGLEQAMAGHIIAQTEIIGLYSRG